MKDKKRHLLQEHEYLSQETNRVKSRFSQLYKHVFNVSNVNIFIYFYFKSSLFKLVNLIVCQNNNRLISK